MKNEFKKILITGDTYLGGGRVKKLSLNKDIDALFGPFLNRIKQADIAITNLESPIINEGEPILKIGPNLKSPVEALPVLKEAGFDAVCLANNHIMDYGNEGLFSTFKHCKNNSLSVVGAGKNQIESEKPLVVQFENLSVGLVNIAENEFGTTTGDEPGAHAMDPVRNFYTIKKTAEQADQVIVIVHGGHENYSLPSPVMKNRYRFYVDAGADLVVGHHPHCYSGMETYGKGSIYYSLGNFLFDKQKSDSSKWNSGFFLELQISKKEIQLEIIPYIQNGETSGLRMLNEAEKSQFENNLKYLSQLISDNDEVEKRFKQYCNSVKKSYASFIEPYSLRLLHSLRNRRLFPSLLSERKKKILLNLARCEAHRDVLIRFLEE